MKLAKRSIKKARIEIVPMIDTIFFLLVFFMISSLSMAQYRGVQVNLPKAASGSQAPAETAALTLTKDGTLYFNKQPMERGALLEVLRGQLQAKPDLLVLINADDGVQHGRVVELMDQARRAGATRLSIAVKPKEDRQ